MKEFRTLAGFAAHFSKIAAQTVIAEARGMEAAAILIETEAKAEIGHYQRDDVGTFEPWQELSGYTKQDRLSKGFTENDPGLRTGAMRDSISHAVALPFAAVGSNDDKMVWFELGTAKNQPPRSVLGVAAYRKATEAAALVGLHVSWVLSGKPPRND